MTSLVKLEDVCDFLDYKRKPVTAKDRVSGPYPYYGANGVQDYVASFLFDDELVLLAEDGGHFDDPTRGVAYRVSGKCWVNNHAHVLKPKDNINIDYLYYILKQYDVRPYITGAIIKKLNQKDAKRMTLKLPPLDEQKQIVNTFYLADTLRLKRKQSLELLKVYLNSVFIEMFGDPINNPRAWQLVKFQEIGSLDRGKSKHRPRNAPELLGGEHPLIQTGDVSNSGIYIEKYNSTYSDIGLKQSRKWPKGTLCITIAANIAKTGILNFEACFPDSVVGFVADNKKTNNEFIHFWISFLQEMLEKNAPESAQKNINLQILRNLEVINPPLELQNKFSKIVYKTELLKQKMLMQSQELDTQFQALMQKSFASEFISKQQAN